MGALTSRKYRNIPVIVDGVSFPSKREADRWQSLRLLERAGRISDLQRQIRLPLHVCGHRVGHIVPDFVYVREGVTVYEDVKSPATITPMFKWKAKHCLLEHGIAIEVVL